MSDAVDEGAPEGDDTGEYDVAAETAEVNDSVVTDEVTEAPDPVVVDAEDISTDVVVDQDDVNPAVVPHEVVSEELETVPDDSSEDLPPEPDFADEEHDEGPQQVKDVARVAREVIDGAWGEGEDRVARLEAQGYDVSEVNAEAISQLGLD